MKNTPFAHYLLFALLAFQALGGIFGGLSLTLSPSGEIMHMPVSMLEGSPFSDFLFPGLILLVLLGLLPLFVAWALFASPSWRWPDKLNIYRGIDWAWTYSLYTGIMLCIWILIEIIFIEFDILQTIFGLVGVAILITALLPSNMRRAGWRQG